MHDWSALLARGADGQRRCAWCGQDELYVRYHDEEWGRPAPDDRLLFEKICLEGFQAGLAWITILRKREAFRRAFADFDFERLARFRPRDVERLLADPGIVRHRGKIESAIHNAKRMRELARAEGSLATFLEPYREPPRVPFRGPLTESEPSRALSKELRKRGWTYVGPTTLYAFLQSVGYVNDHPPGCFARAVTSRAQAARARALR